MAFTRDCHPPGHVSFADSHAPPPPAPQLPAPQLPRSPQFLSPPTSPGAGRRSLDVSSAPLYSRWPGDGDSGGGSGGGSGVNVFSGGGGRVARVGLASCSLPDPLVRQG